MAAIDKHFGELGRDAKVTAIRILAKFLIQRNQDCADSVTELLGLHGFQYVDGNFVPVGTIDAREARYLPISSATEISKAMGRLVSGDDSGAITAACGAVDATAGELYASHGLGRPADDTFAGRVRRVSKALNVYDRLKEEFELLGVSFEDATFISQNLRQAVNSGAEALGRLRSGMGDVHGTKPALKNTAYSSIKLASLISSLLKGDA